MSNNFFDDLLENRKHRKEFVEKLMFSSEYIDWLESFTNEKGSFSTNSFLDGEGDLTNQDKANVQDIQILFEETQEYCDENYLMPTKTDYGSFYSIQHNGVGYFIGFDSSQGASFYCTRLDEPEEDALEFKYIISGVKLPKTVRDEYRLEELSELMEKLFDEGVSIGAITNTTENTLNKIKIKSDKSIKTN